MRLFLAFIFGLVFWPTLEALEKSTKKKDIKTLVIKGIVDSKFVEKHGPNVKDAVKGLVADANVFLVDPSLETQYCLKLHDKITRLSEPFHVGYPKTPAGEKNIK